MANFRKFVASAALFTLVLSFIATPVKAFTDVPQDAWFAPYVEALTNAKVFKSADNFRPADNMNRAEFVKTMIAASGLSTEDAEDAGFTDVPADAWFAPYVNAAVEAGIVQGADKSDKFRPTDSVTRAEAVKIALNTFEISAEDYLEPAASFTDMEGHWAKDLVTAAYNLSIVDGQGGAKDKFDPNAPIARSAVAKIAA